MKGLHHSVIEIKDTENDKIDRILVFLKPGHSKIDLAAARSDAHTILQRVKVHRKLPPQLTDKLFISSILLFGAVLIIRAILLG
ncbi:MAG: hypothetical protein IKU54_02055 [Oscillospiraceae bacterium]|nr:hypothetical protein [Oscillospiraceae bacterium]